jgi:hypothetical protein
VIGNAVHVMKIATGEITEPVEDFPSYNGKDKAAQALGARAGGSVPRA